MKKSKNILLACALVGMSFFYACFSPNKVSVQNLADTYHGDYHYMHPEFTLYQVNDSTALLYYKLNENELLYIRKNQQDSFYSAARIICRVSASYESSQLVDSNSMPLKFSSISNTKNAFDVGAMPLKLRFNNSYVITVTTQDLVSKKQEVTYINAESNNNLGSRNFLVTNNADGQPLFPDYIDSNADLTIRYSKQVPLLTVNFYHRDFPVASPPFASLDSKPFKFTPDSTFTIATGPNNTFNLHISSTKGFYHIETDTANHTGLTIYRVEKHFPDVALAAQLVAPLRYITSNEEYTRLTDASDVKKAVDDFWLNIAGSSQDRARSLIRTYYSRVQDANKFFTSYLEGWKTDRGMIYLIYGPPTVVYRNSNSENWVYGEDRNFMSLNFVFQKINNPFTTNDYALERSPLFRNAWYNAVDIWREGRVY